ncbi:hypothetical protein JTB14_019786 [Gonioctena quinquepunctata]|nr:hypothetical protein JTB14_019786 [Gonioctena quinquepunctata]
MDTLDLATTDTSHLSSQLQIIVVQLNNQLMFWIFRNYLWPKTKNWKHVTQRGLFKNITNKLSTKLGELENQMRSGDQEIFGEVKMRIERKRNILIFEIDETSDANIVVKCIIMILPLLRHPELRRYPE